MSSDLEPTSCPSGHHRLEATVGIAPSRGVSGKEEKAREGTGDLSHACRRRNRRGQRERGVREAGAVRFSCLSSTGFPVPRVTLGAGFSGMWTPEASAVTGNNEALRKQVT